jgi:hypothetical protein
VLLAESFDRSTSLEQYEKSTGRAAVSDGEFSLQVFEPNYMQWSLVKSSFSDTIIDVQAHKAAGPDDNFYGVICRYQDDNNFYFLGIASDGYYGIGSMINGERSLLSGDDLQPTQAVQGGTSINHLHAVCSGTTLSLEVNGQMLQSVQDQNLVQGKAGVFAGDFADAGLQILFDNLLITRPTP